MNVKKSLIDEIKQKRILSRGELFNYICKHYGEVSRPYFYRIVSNLIDIGLLARIDSETYVTEKKNVFSYSLEDKNIEIVINDYGEYSIWDTNVFNKWLNHLLNGVITFIEVDKELMFLVASDLKEAGYNHVLVNPSVDEFFKYFDNQTIVIKPSVKSLIEKDHHISIERLIVELYSNKIAKSLYSGSELTNMLNEIFKTYNVNLNKVYHIAKRKKIYGEFHSYLLKNIDMRYIYHD